MYWISEFLAEITIKTENFEYFRNHNRKSIRNQSVSHIPALKTDLWINYSCTKYCQWQKLVLDKHLGHQHIDTWICDHSDDADYLELRENNHWWSSHTVICLTTNTSFTWTINEWKLGRDKFLLQQCCTTMTTSRNVQVKLGAELDLTGKWRGDKWQCNTIWEVINNFLVFNQKPSFVKHSGQEFSCLFFEMSFSNYY